jgi:hypothetical protein
MFVIRRSRQVREVRRVVVTKDHRSIFPLVVIGICFFVVVPKLVKPNE